MFKNIIHKRVQVILYAGYSFCFCYKCTLDLKCTELKRTKNSFFMTTLLFDYFILRRYNLFKLALINHQFLTLHYVIIKILITDMQQVCNLICIKLTLI